MQLGLPGASVESGQLEILSCLKKKEKGWRAFPDKIFRIFLCYGKFPNVRFPFCSSLDWMLLLQR